MLCHVCNSEYITEKHPVVVCNKCWPKFRKIYPTFIPAEINYFWITVAT